MDIERSEVWENTYMIWYLFSLIYNYLYFVKLLIGHYYHHNHTSVYFPIRWTDHSFWQRGHRLFCWTHWAMQQWWKEWLHSPQTTTHSGCFPPDWRFASPWHLKHASITWTLQMAQVSHSTSHDHIATAFHFFRVNIFSFLLLSNSAPPMSIISSAPDAPTDAMMNWLKN